MRIEKTRQEIHKFNNKFFIKSLHVTVTHAIMRSKKKKPLRTAKEEEECTILIVESLFR